MNFQIKMMIVISIITVFLGCGEDFTEAEAQEWTLIELEQPTTQDQPVTINQLEEAFQECSDYIGLNCSEGDKITEKPDSFSFGCDIFVLSSGDSYSRYNPETNSGITGDSKLNLYSLGNITSYLFNLTSSEEYSDWPEPTIPLPYTRQTLPDMRLISTEIVEEEDLTICSPDHNFPEYNVCWPAMTQTHLQNFKEFCVKYGETRVIKQDN